MFRRFIPVALALALSSTSVFADVTERKSLQIVNDITSEVRQYTRFTIFDDVNVQLEPGGVAVLSGKVTMPFKKDDIGRIVSRVAGVSSVKNDIAVLPVSAVAQKGLDPLKEALWRAVQRAREAG